MKKLIAWVLALALVLAAAAAYAAKIEVKNVLDGESYTAYKILNYTTDGTAYSYFLTADEYDNIGAALEAAGFTFTQSADGSEYVVNDAESIDPGAAAEYLGAHLNDLGEALGKKTATGADGEAAFDGLSTGFYFVTSSAGSLCALHSDVDIAEAVEKNTIPTEDKTQSADGDTYSDNDLDFNIGDTVHYKVEITDGKGTNATLTLTDTMTDGLTYQDDAKVYVDGNEVTAGENTFSVDHDTPASGFTIVFVPAYVASLDEGHKIVVKYSAKINENAAIDSNTNTNTAELKYSEQTQTDSVNLETYDFTVYKTDGTEFLDGAEFKLYDAATGGNQILLKKDNTGYVLDTSDSASADVTIDINSDAGCNVRGLAPGTYYLEEVVVPDGYNKLSARTEVTLTSGQTEPVQITVENNAGAELPSTGGMGTTIFYVIGGLLIIGAAIVLIARRKAQD